MRKTLKIALPVLLVLAMLLTSIFVFAGISGAADTEATLSTQTLTMRGAYVDTFGTASNASGDFSELAATLATLAPTTDTRYTLKLNQNITLDEPIVISTNEFCEVLIDLNGYTLTTATDGDAIVVEGNARAVRISGNYNADGERGRIVYAQSSGAILAISEGATAHAHFRNIDANLTALPSGSAALSVKGGTLTVYSSTLAYENALGTDVTLIDAANALLEVKNSVITAETNGALTSSAISANATDVVLLDTVINAKTAIATTGACDIATVTTDIVANSPITLSSTSSTAYILGGRVEAKGGAIVGGTFDKAKTVLYYGVGDTTIVGDDPANYTVQTNCSFNKNAAGEWVIAYSGTQEAMATNLIIGSAPDITVDTLDNAWKKLNTNKANQSVTVINIVTLLKDATHSSYSDTSTNDEWYNRIIDLNGHTFTENGSGNYDTYGSPYIHYDGADANGKIGTLISNGEAPMYVRLRVKKNYLGANEFTLYMFNNIKLVATKVDKVGSEGNPFFCFQQGEASFNNVEYIYDGTKSTSTANRGIIIVNTGSSSAVGGTVVHMNNVSFADTATNQFMITKFYVPKYNTRAWFDNVTINGADYAINSTDSGTRTVLRNSSISTVSTPYTGTGIIEIHDTVTTLGASGVMSSGGISPMLYYGTGKTVVNSEADLTGSYSVESGYSLVMSEKGKYVLMNSADLVSPSVTMPAVFANNMVLQRNKELNVYGFCETEGAVIEVTLAGRTATATVEGGRWCATFEPFGAMFDQTLEVRQTGNVGYNLIKYTGVNIGEVWVMTGQSNAQLFTRFLEDAVEYANLADTITNLRIFASGSSPALNPQKLGSGTWYNLSSSIVKGSTVSAIGYVVAAKLAQELGPDVPVAIMHVNRGATKIKTWLDYETLKSVSPSSANEYDYWHSQGTLPENSHSSSAIGSVMYNRFIAPLEGFNVAGVMWYQGEGDTGGGYYASTKEYGTIKDAEGNVIETVYFRKDENGQPYLEDQDNSYTEFFYALQDSMRNAFGNDDELPFYVMQLSPFLSSSYLTENVYKLKLEQYEMCKNRENTYLVSLATDGTIIEDAFFGEFDPDLGSSSTSTQGFIHPIRKSTVAIRTADMILANEYGIKYADVYTYPTPLSAVHKDGKITITFDTELRYFYGESVLGFEVYDGAKWVKLGGVIDGNKVVLDAEGVTSAEKLRYGCGETLIELGDGTIIEITNGTYTYSTANHTVTVNYNGQSYVIRMNTTDMTRTIDYGNITNISGVPMPIFGMEITAG